MQLLPAPGVKSPAATIILHGVRMTQRTRSRGDPHVATYTPCSGKMFYSNTTTATTNYNGSRVGTYEYMLDYVTPGFKRQSANGRVFNNPLTKHKYSYSATPSSVVFLENPPSVVGATTRYRQEWQNMYAVVKGPLKAPVDPVQPTGHLLYNWVPNLDETSLMSRAATAALSDSREKSAQGLVIVAEMRKTLETLRNPIAASLKHLRNIPKEVRRKRTRRNSGSVDVAVAKEIAKGASSQYLAWFYGLRTVMFDVEDVMAGLEKQYFDRQTGRGFVADEYVAAPVVANLYSHAASHNATVTETYRERCEVRAGAMIQLEGMTTASRLGFDIRSIPEALWELTPWSFVVDWFVNVQDVLGALEAVVSGKFLAQWIVRKRYLTFTRQVSGHHVTSVGASWLTIGSPCTDGDKVVVEMYDRIPQDIRQLIALKGKFNLSKIPATAAISLVVQQLLKGR